MSTQTPDSFRQCMRRLASSVSIITCAHEGKWHGITVTSVTSLSFEPQALLCCIKRTASVSAPLLESRRFCVNLLGRTQSAVSHAFSGALPPAERFDPALWDQGTDGIPYLRGAQAILFCETDQTVAYATHDIVIGRVTGSCFADDVAPLLYQNGEYAAATPLGREITHPSVA